MDKKSQLVLVLGIAITLVTLFFNFYAAGVVFILFATIFMSLQIMNDTVSIPNVSAHLADDAKAIILRNSGNSAAVNIHVALVPLNVEYDVPSLAVDAIHTHPLPSMVQDIKAVVTFENEDKVPFSRTYPLSALGGEYDPFKPMIPIFKWK
jgi:hypothetical protein